MTAPEIADPDLVQQKSNRERRRPLRPLRRINYFAARSFISERDSVSLPENTSKIFSECNTCRDDEQSNPCSSRHDAGNLWNGHFRRLRFG